MGLGPEKEEEIKAMLRRTKFGFGDYASTG